MRLLPGLNFSWRLIIKEEVCQEYDVVSYVPAHVNEEIDRRIASALAAGRYKEWEAR